MLLIISATQNVFASAEHSITFYNNTSHDINLSNLTYSCMLTPPLNSFTIAANGGYKISFEDKNTWGGICDANSKTIAYDIKSDSFPNKTGSLKFDHDYDNQQGWITSLSINIPNYNNFTRSCNNENCDKAIQTKTDAIVTFNPPSDQERTFQSQTLNLTNYGASFSAVSSNVGCTTSNKHSSYPGGISLETFNITSNTTNYMNTKCAVNVNLPESSSSFGVTYTYNDDALQLMINTVQNSSMDMSESKPITTCVNTDPTNSNASIIKFTSNSLQCFMGCKGANESGAVVTYKYHHLHKIHKLVTLHTYPN